jgi:hypothetical protein
MPYRDIDIGFPTDIEIDSGILPTAQSLTLSAGNSITPTGSGEINIIVLGAGGAVDLLESIVAAAGMINTKAYIRNGNATPVTNTITVVTSASLIVGASNFVMDDASDLLVLLCTAVNTWIQISGSDNVHH